MASSVTAEDVEMKDVPETEGSKANAETPDTITSLKEKAREQTAGLSNGNGDHPKNGEDPEDPEGSSIDEDDEDNSDIEEVERVNGMGDNSSLSDDDEDMMAEEEEIIEELDDDDDDDDDIEDEEEEGEVSFNIKENGTSESSQAQKQSRRKSPVTLREVEEVESDDDENDVEEVKDDESGDDSDIMEVEAEDPLAAAIPQNTEVKNSTPNVVTIDDVKTLHKIANAKRQAAETADKPVVIDTSTILAGKATSGVTITPARPKSSNPPSLHSLSSGVTISSTKGPTMPLRAGGTGQISAARAFGYDEKGQLNDPNLTDDTFVVEAPSFIVPYVYEKPPKETFEAFKKDIERLTKEAAAKKKKEEEDDKKGDEESGEKADSDKDSEMDTKDKDAEEKTKEDSKSKEDDDIVEIKKDGEVKKVTNYFDSTLGKFLIDLGMNLVQENVQTDLLKQQIKRSQKDKSAAVMHAIMSLKKNLESSKDHNEPFHFKERKCRFCSFRAESDLVLQHHLETPHMKMMMYRCNFCSYETKLPNDVLTHMMTAHGVRGRLERAPALHQCPQCTFEDNMKGKLTRHKNSCDKRFKAERNQEPPMDWEPPAKIPKPSMLPRRPGMAGYTMGAAQQLSHMANMRQNASQFQQNRGIYSGMPQLQMGPRGRGRPLFKGDVGKFGNSLSMPRHGLNMNSFAFNKASNQMLNMAGGNFLNNQVVLQAMNQQGNRFSGNKLLSNLGSNSSVTIQSVSQRNANNRSNTSPSISITPLPGRQNSRPMAKVPPVMNSMKPGHPSSGAGSQAGKGSFVICEICDGYIKDLEQLRNHMLWIHKVKIHPKMIYNRPPLNCQKCQFRFFTDQGLERHLLGSHGLVTASMQELANKGQDSGRCPVCGKVYQWKLLNHVAKDHQKTLKPAHLSYKCTVCTATFGQYKLFETHVYQAHSGAAKKGAKQQQQSKPATAAPSSKPASIKVPNDITVIPKSANNKPSTSDPSMTKKTSSPAPTKAKDAEVIELDDDEEIDDVESEEKKNKDEKEKSPVPEKKGDGDSGDEEGVEEIEDEEPEDE